MPTPKQIRKFVEGIIDSKVIDYPTSATVEAIDGNLADIKLPGRSTHMRNCRIVGDPNQIAIGMTVGLTWEDYNGTMRPIVYAPGGGGGGENRILFSVGGSSGGGVVTDGITIENSATQGLRVKKAGISLKHLSFVPALSDHQHGIGEVLPGWEVSNDGVLFSDQVSINPLGTITLGRDPDIVKLGVEDSTYRIWAGNSTPSSAPFSVSKTGHLISSSATIAGWTISASQISKSGIILDSSAPAIYIGAALGITLYGPTETIFVGSASPQIIIDGTNKIIKSGDYQPGASGFGIQATDGFAEFNNVRVRGSLSASVFEYGDIQATAGTLMVSRSAAKLEDDFTSPSSLGGGTNLDVTNDNVGTPLFSLSEDIVATAAVSSGGTGYTVGDILTITGGTAQVEVLAVATGIVSKIWVLNRGSGYTAGTKATTGGTGTGCTITVAIKDEGDILRIKTIQTTGIKECWFEITTKSDQGSWTRYYSLLRSGNTSTTFEKGTGIADIGQHNTGIIYLSADETVGYSANMSFIQWWRNRVSALSVTTAGSGYAIGDILRINDTGALLPCKVEVATLVGTTTGVATVTIIEYGSDYTTGSKSTWAEDAAGTPSGCQINLTAVSNPWDTQFLFGRLGNIKSSYGAPAEDRYGFGFGDYSSGNYMSYNAEIDDGFILSGGDGVVQLSANGITLEASEWVGEKNALSWMEGTKAIGRLWADATDNVSMWSYANAIGLVAGSYNRIEAHSDNAYEAEVGLLAKSGSNIAGITVSSQGSTQEVQIYGIDKITTGITGSFYQAHKGTLQVTDNTTPASGVGIEIGWHSTYGRILAYDRDSPGDKLLQLRGSEIQLNTSGTNYLYIKNGDVYTQPWQSYASTVDGWSSYTTKQIYFKTIGDTVFVKFYILGTSDDTTASFTVPYTNNAQIQVQDVCRVGNNGSNYTVGMFNLPVSSQNVSFWKDVSAAPFTNSGAKLVIGEFFYQRA